MNRLIGMPGAALRYTRQFAWGTLRGARFASIRLGGFGEKSMKGMLTTAADGTGSAIDRPTAIFVAARPDFSVEGLVRILSDSTENDVVACVEPTDACWDKLRATAPDVILLHHSAVVTPIREFFMRIREAAPAARIVVFGQHMEDLFLFNIVRAGAAGYINENMNGSNVLHAIREVQAGRLWVERRILEATAKAAIDLERTLEQSIMENIDAVCRVLSKRESAVFRLVLEGLATKEIADRLHLSEQSVKLHLGRIFKKFQVTNRSQLILQAFSKICPVSNVYRLIRMTLDRRRIEAGRPPLIKDVLADDAAPLRIERGEKPESE